MASDLPYHDRKSEVERALSQVYDPELDETVTDLRFVSAIDIKDDGVVEIAFRLPTYWCSPNFAFMMAADMREAVVALPWVTRADVTLDEHMYAKSINEAIGKGVSFKDAFKEGAADGNLDALRHTFLQKAFRRRQERLLSHLMTELRLTPVDIAGLTVRQLRDLGGSVDGLIDGYLARRQVVGDYDDQSLAFVDVEAVPIAAEALERYVADLRRYNINTMHNGVMCRRLLEVRYNLPPAQDAFSDQTVRL